MPALPLFAELENITTDPRFKSAYLLVLDAETYAKEEDLINVRVLGNMFLHPIGVNTVKEIASEILSCRGTTADVRQHLYELGSFYERTIVRLCTFLVSLLVSQTVERLYS